MGIQGRPASFDVPSMVLAYCEHGVCVTALGYRFGVSWATIHFHLVRAGVWHGRRRRRSARKEHCRIERVLTESAAGIVNRFQRICEWVEVEDGKTK